MGFDVTSLHPSAMWDRKSVYPKKETRAVFKPHMNETHVDAFNNQSFNQDGNEPAILKLK